MWLALKLDVIKATGIDWISVARVPSLWMFCRITESLYSISWFSTVTLRADRIRFARLQKKLRQKKRNVTPLLAISLDLVDA